MTDLDKMARELSRAAKRRGLDELLALIHGRMKCEC